MTIYLRNKKKQTVLDVELTEKNDLIDVRSAVDIEAYSEILLENPSQQADVIETFSTLSSLRRWLWEYYEFTDGEQTFAAVKNEIIQMMSKAAHRFNLFLVED